tara:strand:- start:872 stop:2479 length:1608 start_codon:yes stop_codon:yes gene_type:complete
MNIKSSPVKFILSILLSILAFYINYYYANKGLYPIDTFSFFDSAYYITEGQHPIKDFWVISGIFIDYLQALFFYIFGFNWNSYIFHASFFNIIVSLFFFYFLNQFNKNILYNLFLSICVAILCYPIIGTPFPYQHSLILSIISILVFYLAVFRDKKKYWFVLPLIMVFSFLSMQLPSGLINLLIIIFSIIFLILRKNKNLIFFLAGSLVSIVFLFLYFSITKVSINDFITQIILFPLDVGLSRITSDQEAFESAKIVNKLTFRGTFGHFKFIFFFIFANITLILFHIKNKGKKSVIEKKVLINLFILLCTLCFLFHQLITANQTFIFCLIPILGGLFFLQVDEFVDLKLRNKIKILVIILVAFSTVKYHLVYNEKRKFVDLQNVDISKAVNADLLSSKFNNLKWITPNKHNANPLKELKLIDESIKIIKSDKREKMLITHYQFFSLILNENLNIPNRWYYTNNTFPTSNKNIYYDKYIEKFFNKVNQKKIKVIYLAKSSPAEFRAINFSDLLKNDCFTKKKYNEILYSIKINNCN